MNYHWLRRTWSTNRNNTTFRFPDAYSFQEYAHSGLSSSQSSLLYYHDIGYMVITIVSLIHGNFNLIVIHFITVSHCIFNPPSTHHHTHSQTNKTIKYIKWTYDNTNRYQCYYLHWSLQTHFSRHIYCSLYWYYLGHKFHFPFCRVSYH